MQNEINNNPLNQISEEIDINTELAHKFYDDKEFEKSVNYYKEILKRYYIISTMDSNVKEQFIDLAELIYYLKRRISDCFNNLGEIYYNNKEFEKAINSYKEALSYHECDDKTYFKLGLSFRGLKLYDTAITFLKKTIKLNPSFEDTYKIIGDIYTIDKKIPQESFKAFRYYSKYLTMNKSDGYVYNNLAYLLLDNRLAKYTTLNKQIELLNKSIKLLPDLELGLKNLALVYCAKEEYDKAIDCYKRLQQKFPNGNHLFDLSLLQIKIGEFAEGLKNFEHRLTALPHLCTINKDLPIWKGASLKRKRILIVWEQAFGDNIQFIRYLPFLEKQAQKVIFKPQKELYSLIKHNYPSIEIVPHDIGWDNIKFDFHQSLISVPYYLKMNFENIPYKEGYIKADPEKTANLKKEFFENDDLKIGIHWKVASKDNNNKIVNANRIINLESFFPITKFKNVKVYSLQKKDGEEDLKNLPEDVKIINVCDKIQDFDDTAAMIENMDLIITNDSSIVHLAGSMGKKTFLLIPKDSDWKWFMNEETTPWYSSVKMFKQKEYFNWEEVTDRVLAQIKQDYDLKS